MMQRIARALAAALLVGLGGCVQAQTTPNPVVGDIACLAKYGPAAALPDALAPGYGVVSRNNGWGNVWAWWCNDAYGYPRQQSWVILHTYRWPSNVNPVVVAALTDPNPLEAVRRISRDYGRRPTSGSEKTAETDLHRLGRAALATPVLPAWQVDRGTNSTGAPTRPTYEVVDGVRSADAGPLRAPEAVQCLCDLGPRGAGAHERVAWCRWKDGPASTVTLCARVR